MNKFPGKYLFFLSSLSFVCYRTKYIEDQSQGLGKKEEWHGSLEQLAFLGTPLTATKKLNQLSQSRDLFPGLGWWPSIWDANTSLSLSAGLDDMT